jgi:hypothetical protein
MRGGHYRTKERYDLPNAAKHSTVPMFADDSKCYRQITQPRDRNLLQSDLDSLHHWSSTWDLNFNTKKCAALRFSRRKTSAPTQGYVLNQKPILKFAATQNDLGILVSNDLKWSSHVINIVAKANRMLGFLRRNCFHLTDVNARRLLYLSLVRSHFHLLICFVSRAFNVELRNSFSKIMNLRILIVWKTQSNSSILLAWN